MNRLLRMTLHRLSAVWFLSFAISPVLAQWGGVEPATTFNPGGGNSAGFDLDITAVALQADGKIIVGGGFTQDGRVSRNRVARLNSNGTLDTSFDPGTGVNNTVEAVALQPDGKVVIVGRFTAVNAVPRAYVARLNANGALDSSFNPAPDDIVAAVALQADGKILISGAFNTVDGMPRDHVARLTSDGLVDPGFVPAGFVDVSSSGPYLEAIALQADGRIVIGGEFTEVGGLSRNRIARLKANGSLDETFSPGPGANDDVTTLAMQADGKILAGGSFTNMANTTRYYLARLNSDGSLDATFNPNIALTFGGLITVKVQVDGKILIGGDFKTIEGLSRNDIARLNPNGSLDTTFDPGTGPATPNEVPRVRAIAVQPDGKIVVGGGFITFNTVKLNYIARLLGDQGGTVEFASASDNVDEKGGNASVAVRRTGSTIGSVSVNYATGGGTATADLDYRAQPGVLVFGPGESSKVISVPILPDSLIEGNETVNLSLGNPIGGEILGNQKTFTLTIIDNTNSVANSAPVLTAISNQQVNEQSPLTFTAAAIDSDGDALAFSLDPGAPSGAGIDPTSGVFSWTPLEVQGPGTYSITVRVTDSGSPPLSDTKSFSVAVNEVNNAPVLGAQIDRVIDELTALVVTNLASDGDVPANGLTYRLVSPPAGASIDANGVIRWTPSEAQGPGTYPITTVVTDDGVPPMSATNRFVVTVNEVNNSPMLGAQTDRVIDEMTALAVTNRASDGDLPVNGLTYQLVSPPAGANIDANGVIRWTPSEAQGPGTYAITTAVTDNGAPAMSATNSFMVTVNEVNRAPVLWPISPVPDQTAFPGAQLVVLNSAGDSDFPTNTLTFSLDPGAPGGAVIDAATGVFTWTPATNQASGTYPVTVRVKDNGAPSLSDAKSFIVVVASAPVIESIAVSSGSASITWGAVAGKSYRVQFKPDLKTATWSDLSGDITASGSTAMKMDTTISGAERFYRIVLLP